MKAQRVALLGVLALGLAACVADDKISGERDALVAIREVFGTKILGNGALTEGAFVVSVTRTGISWIDGGGPVRQLAWADLEDVEYQQDQERPAHPETLYLYLARGAPSVESSGAVQPPLSGAEVVRCYVLLRDRPRGSRSRLVRALRELGRATKPPRPAAAPPPRPADTAPPTSASLTTEQKLARLKELHEKGLITDDVYRDEQRKVLEGGY